MTGARFRFVAAALVAMPVAQAAAATAHAPPAASASGARDTGNADARVKLGVDAWHARNYDSAVAIWRPLAEAGNPDAEFNLAQAYRLGHGVSSNPATAMDWYLKAARQDHEQAQTTYGLMLFQSGDQKGALPWLQKAADHGDPRALYVVGTALFNGDLMPKDWVRAYAMMSRAAAGGLPQARASLAEMDRYVPVDQREKGIALARTMVPDAPRSSVSLAAATSPAAARPAPTPIRTTELPPSLPANPPAAAAPVTPASRPEPAPVAVARTDGRPVPAPTSGAGTGASGWRIQLGAYSNEAKARALWEGLSHRIAQLGGKQPYLVKAGAVTRLQAGPFENRGAAEQACTAARAAHQDCFTTRAGG